MNIKKHIPNFITLLNLTSGIIAIYFASQGGSDNLSVAGTFLFVAAVFDFLDGFSARLLRAPSEIGVQLDSLADAVSFTVAPGFILYRMILLSHGKPVELIEGIDFVPLVAVLVPWFGTLRLAKFNIDTEQQYSFKGLPTPALALLIASLPLIRQFLYSDRGFFYMIITNSYFLIGIAILGSLLLVSNFPMFSLKFTTYGLKENMIKYSFLAISFILILFLQVIAVPFIFVLYLFFSLVIYLTDIQG